MHNALKWLIAKQGVQIGSMTMVVWESNLAPLPNVFNKLDQLYEEDWEDDEPEEQVEGEQEKLNADTLAAYRSKIHKAVWGKRESIDVKSKAMIMMLDAATTGRLAMTMYMEMETSQFLKNIEKWHQDIAWIRFNREKKGNEIQPFSLHEIADYVMGTEQGDFVKCKPEIKTDIMMRLVKCLIEGRGLPRDILTGIVNKASNPLAYKKTYNYRVTLELACGLIRKFRIDEERKNGKEGVCGMALDYECKTRDYLYGRLLAVADAAEAATYNKGDERTTNAKRYFESFANRPYQTWDVIYKRIRPYMDKMSKGQQVYYGRIIDEIMENFDHSKFNDNSKLAPEFLHAYSCQLNEIYKKKEDKGEE